MISKEDIDAMKPEPEETVKVFTGWGSHRWSGWPGAYCMHCGVFDPHEQAVAGDNFPFPADLDNPTPEEQQAMKDWYKANDGPQCPKNTDGKDPYSF